jgi:diguanylate cyclase (GGDEF)-like protein
MPKALRYGIVMSSLIVLLNLAFILFIETERWKLDFINLTYPLWNLLAAGALFFAAKQTSLLSWRRATAWGFLALALLAVATGNILWAIFETGLGIEPFPSPADGFYLVYYPLVLIGVLLLPTRELHPSDRWRMGLDVSIVLVAATLVIWTYWLGPLAAIVHEDRLIVWLLSLAYPVGSLILLGALLMLLYRQPKGEQPGPLVLVALSLGMGILGDMVYGYQAMAGVYESATWLDLTWLVGSLFYFMAGVWQGSSVTARAVTVHRGADRAVQQRLNSWLTYLPYAWAIGAFLMLEESHGRGDHLNSWLTVGVGLVISLVLVRQLLTLRENDFLFAQVRQQAAALAQTNQELQVEIEERKRAEQRLAHDALHDSLTGLPNRVLFLDRLRHAIEIAKRRQEHRFAVLFLDLDHFKVVNDSLGHIVGDQLLISIAHRLRLCLRAGDTVARLGGDEFVILLEEIVCEDDATTTADQILTILRQPFNLGAHEFPVTASIGIIADAGSYDRPEDVLRDADLAMYQAKAHGKARSEIFTVELRERAQLRLELENDLRHALERNELELYYQPILSLQSDHVTGFEALLRWRHAQRGLIPPNEFIPIAEETGLIVPIGQWVLHEACHQLRRWHDRFPQRPPLAMSVNISGVQFAEPTFIDQVETTLEETGLDPTTLRLELTERVWLNSNPETVALFRRLNKMGIQLHIDDFGTGYSSLAYLQNFPIRMLKIDRVFLNQMDEDSNSKDIVRAVIAMAHDLGIEAVAEGVETVEQLESLKRFGCNYGQGYLFSRPVEQAAVEEMLSSADRQPAFLLPVHLFTASGPSRSGSIGGKNTLSDLSIGALADPGAPEAAFLPAPLLQGLSDR